MKTLIYSRPLKMTDLRKYQAEVVNYFIGTLEECLREEKKQQKLNFKTEITNL